MDDEESVKFCEEDIDQILERRSTVVRHDTGERSSIFSKATFSVSQNDDDVDVNDTNFWDKFAKKANLEEVVEPSENEKLILFERRHRKQVQRFGVQNEDIDQYFSEADDEHPKKKNEKVYPWCFTEKVRFERCLMQHGFGQWEKMKSQFSRRSINDLKACAHALVQFCLEVEKYNSELLKDIKELFNMPENTPSYEDGTPMDRSKLIIDPEIPYLKATKKQITEFKSFLINAPEEYKQHLKKKAKNLLSRLQLMHVIHDKIMKRDPSQKFPTLQSAPPEEWWGEQEDRDLVKGVHKYGYQQYESIKNDEEFCFCKRKYKTNDTSNTHHENESTIGDNESKADMELNSKIDIETNDDDNESALDSSADRLAVSTPDIDEKLIIKNELDSEDNINDIKMESTEDVKMENVNDIKKENTEDVKMENVDDIKKENTEDVKMENVNEIKKENDASSNNENTITTDKEIKKESNDEIKSEEDNEILYNWPSAGDIGIRLRKVVSAYQRLFQQEARQKEKLKKLEKHKQQVQANRQQMLQNRAKEKLDRIKSHLSKSEKITFQRTVSSYGIMNKNEDGTRDWSNFKKLSNLDKTDECMESYFEELMDICHVVIKRDEEKKAKEKEGKENESNTSTDHNQNKSNNEEGQTPASETEEKKPDKYENFTIEKAKRLLRRIDLLKKLREVILPKDDLDDILKYAKKPARSGLPTWWVCGEHDKALLQSIAEYGILRPDLTISDPKYPFKELIEKAKEEEQKESVIDMSQSDKKDGHDALANIENSSSVQSTNSVRVISSNATQMEKDWMKEMVIVRRFESLCDMVLNEKKINRLKRKRSSHQISNSQRSETESVNEDERTGSANKKTKYTLKFHIPSLKSSSEPTSSHKSRKSHSNSKSGNVSHKSHHHHHHYSKHRRSNSKRNAELDREVKRIIQNRKRKALTGIDSDSSLDSFSDLSSDSRSELDSGSASESELEHSLSIKRKAHSSKNHSDFLSSDISMSSDSDIDSETIRSPQRRSSLSTYNYNSDNDSGMDTDEMLNRAERNLNVINTTTPTPTTTNSSSGSGHGHDHGHHGRHHKSSKETKLSTKKSPEKPQKKRIKLFRTSSPKVKISSKPTKSHSESKLKDNNNTPSSNTTTTDINNTLHSPAKPNQNKKSKMTNPSENNITSKTSIKIRTSTSNDLNSANSSAIKLPKIKFKSLSASKNKYQKKQEEIETEEVQGDNTNPVKSATTTLPKKKNFLQEYPSSPSSSSSSASSSSPSSSSESESEAEPSNPHQSEEKDDSSSSESDVWLGSKKK